MLERQLSRICFYVGFFLPTFAVEVLPKISEMVKQAYRYQRQAEIARRFQMIAGQHSKPTGIERQ